ncbi:hypothetical protein E2C01_081322 [Portunus trituberculatus]|uniref:Uncharacterized protein n=1 Tax=Portunus trituberculatus TaxID=210409 RepID=A0A5B7IRM6_PORTR|nr:hypothetical protein [Portunus trituberculatus]
MTFSSSTPIVMASGNGQSPAEESKNSSTGRLDEEIDGCFPVGGGNGKLVPGSSGQWFTTGGSKLSNEAKSGRFRR